MEISTFLGGYVSGIYQQVEGIFHRFSLVEPCHPCIVVEVFPP